MSDWKVYEPNNPVILTVALLMYSLTVAPLVSVVPEVAELADWPTDVRAVMMFALFMSLLFAIWFALATTSVIFARYFGGHEMPTAAGRGPKISYDRIVGASQTAAWLILIVLVATNSSTGTAALRESAILWFLFYALLWSPLPNMGARKLSNQLQQRGMV